MVAATQTSDAAAARAAKRRFRLRKDLRIEPQLYAGEPCFIVKDPVSLAYFRFSPREYEVLRLLDGRTVKRICDGVERKWRRPRPDAGEIEAFLSRLVSSGLVTHSGSSQGRTLHKRSETMRRQRRGGGWGSLLYIKFPGVDPEPVLRRIHPWMKWIYSPAAVIAAACLVLFSMGYSAVRADEFANRFWEESLGQYLSVQTILWLWVALGISKVLHEFGHGLTCKHFGGECHDMGMLLLVFTPCMYCDASDAWTMSNKWHRIAISAGGIYVELVIASLASLVWWHTSEGVIHSIALALMIICSINTFVVNSNPLLRFDGYYILSDLVEIPNLRQKAQQTLRAFFHRNLFGWTSTEISDLLSGSRRRLFLFYAVAAWLYRWLLCATVLWFFYNALKPYRLGSVSAVLACVVALQMLVIPMWRNFRRMKKMQRQQAPRDWGRMLVGWSVVAGLVAVVVLLPIPRRVKGVLVVQGRGQHPVHVEIAGRLDEVNVAPGEAVRQGDVLGVLSNPALDLELARLQGEVQRIEALAAKHRSLGRPGEEQVARELLERKLLEIASREEQRERLILRADSDGIVVPAPRREQQRVETSSYVQLTSWTQAPLREENIGGWLETGTTICELRPSREPEAVMVVEQGDVEFLEMGQRVWIKFDALPQLTVPAMIREISRKEAEAFPEQLLAAAGGELQTQRGEDGRITAAGTFYEVRASIDPASIDGASPVGDLLPYGSRGRAKIECGSWTCWDLLVRQFHRLFFMA